MVTLCTVLSGGDDCTDMAEFAGTKLGLSRGFLKLEHGVPSHDTFGRLCRLLDPEQFRACLQRFMEGFADACQGVVAIDGKVLRRSFDTASGKSTFNMVSAWGCEQRLVIQSHGMADDFAESDCGNAGWVEASCRKSRPSPARLPDAIAATMP